MANNIHVNKIYFMKHMMRLIKLTGNAKQWHEKLHEQKNKRTELLSLESDIRDAMINYLKSVGETEEFSLIFESFGAVKLACNGDLFDLEQIGGFCDVFNLEIVLTNRLVVENFIANTTEIKTNYLFQTKIIDKRK